MGDQVKQRFRMFQRRGSVFYWQDRQTNEQENIAPPAQAAQDYDGGPIKIAGVLYASAIPAQPLDKKSLRSFTFPQPAPESRDSRPRSELIIHLAMKVRDGRFLPAASRAPTPLSHRHRALREQHDAEIRHGHQRGFPPDRTHRQPRSGHQDGKSRRLGTRHRDQNHRVQKRLNRPLRNHSIETIPRLRSSAVWLARCLGFAGAT